MTGVGANLSAGFGAAVTEVDTFLIELLKEEIQHQTLAVIKCGLVFGGSVSV